MTPEGLFGRRMHEGCRQTLDYFLKKATHSSPITKIRFSLQALERAISCRACPVHDLFVVAFSKARCFHATISVSEATSTSANNHCYLGVNSGVCMRGEEGGELAHQRKVKDQPFLSYLGAQAGLPLFPCLYPSFFLIFVLAFCLSQMSVLLGRIICSCLLRYICSPTYSRVDKRRRNKKNEKLVSALSAAGDIPSGRDIASEFILFPRWINFLPHYSFSIITICPRVVLGLSSRRNTYAVLRTLYSVHRGETCTR